MLTSDLAVSRRRGERLFPFLVKTGDPVYLRDAEILIRIFRDFENETRGALERELEEYVGTGTDYRILRGFIKLLTDRCEFQTSATAEPEEIRRRIFLEACKRQPVLPGSQAKEEVLKKIAEEFQIGDEALLSGIYADLSARQRLISFDQIEPQELLELYNLAQAQALLYRAVEMRILAAPSTAENYRAIFGWIKHFGLIHSVAGNAADGYEIRLTGAASLFHRSQKYGIRMAVFLPALLLCRDWEMRAEIAQKEGGNLFYELSSRQTDLKSSYPDEPEYKNPDAEKLKTAWEKSALNWRLQENREVVDLGKTAFAPDFLMISPEGEKIYLDVLGFWTPKSLKKRLEEFETASFTRFLLAAGQDLRGSRDEPLWTSDRVVFYKTKILPQHLEEAAKKIL